MMIGSDGSGEEHKKKRKKKKKRYNEKRVASSVDIRTLVLVLDIGLALRSLLRLGRFRRRSGIPLGRGFLLP